MDIAQLKLVCQMDFLLVGSCLIIVSYATLAPKRIHSM